MINTHNSLFKLRKFINEIKKKYIVLGCQSGFPNKIAIDFKSFRPISRIFACWQTQRRIRNYVSDTWKNFTKGVHRSVNKSYGRSPLLIVSGRKNLITCAAFLCFHRSPNRGNRGWRRRRWWFQYTDYIIISCIIIYRGVYTQTDEQEKKNALCRRKI